MFANKGSVDKLRQNLEGENISILESKFARSMI